MQLSMINSIFLFFADILRSSFQPFLKNVACSGETLKRLLRLRLPKRFLKILQHIIFIYFEMPSVVQELYFHTANKFHSFIFKPYSDITNLEASSLKLPSCIDWFYGGGSRKHASLIFVSILWGKQVMPKLASEISFKPSQVRSRENYFVFYANFRFVYYSICVFVMISFSLTF